MRRAPRYGTHVGGGAEPDVVVSFRVGTEVAVCRESTGFATHQKARRPTIWRLLGSAAKFDAALLQDHSGRATVTQHPQPAIVAEHCRSLRAGHLQYVLRPNKNLIRIRTLKKGKNAASARA